MCELLCIMGAMHPRLNVSQEWPREWLPPRPSVAAPRASASKRLEVVHQCTLQAHDAPMASARTLERSHMP